MHEEDFIFNESPSIKPLDKTDPHNLSLPSLQLSSSDSPSQSTNSSQQSSRRSSIAFFQKAQEQNQLSESQNSFNPSNPLLKPGMLIEIKEIDLVFNALIDILIKMKPGWSKDTEQFVRLAMNITYSQCPAISKLDQKKISKNKNNIEQFVKDQYERAAKIQKSLELQRQTGDFLKENEQRREYQQFFIECYLSGLMAENLLRGTFSFSDFENVRLNLMSTLPNPEAKLWHPEKRPYNEEKEDRHITNL